MSNPDRIVVGVDGSDGGRRALRSAAVEAQRTNAAVDAITAWYWDGAESARSRQFRYPVRSHIVGDVPTVAS